MNDSPHPRRSSDFDEDRLDAIIYNVPRQSTREVVIMMESSSSYCDTYIPRRNKKIVALHPILYVLNEKNPNHHDNISTFLLTPRRLATTSTVFSPDCYW